MKKIIAVALSFAMFGATAQSLYNSKKPIKIIVPTPAGSPLDVETRLLADKLSAEMNTAFVVDYRPGAGGVVAATELLKSTDGHTFAYLTHNILAINPHYFDLPYDTRTDLKLVAKILTENMVIAVNPNSGITSFAELLNRARTADKPLQIATSAKGTAPYLISLLIQDKFNIRLEEIPHKGTPDALRSVLAGEIMITVDSINSIRPYIANGRLRPLATTSKSRISIEPGIPTIAEATGTAFSYEVWLAIVAPRSTSDEQVAEMQRAIQAVFNKTDIKTVYSNHGWRPATNPSTKDVVSLFTEEYAYWANFIKTTNFKEKLK